MNSSANSLADCSAEAGASPEATEKTRPGFEPASVSGNVLPTFLRFVSASIFGLLALSSAAIVDGIMVGKMLGADALAAVNLLIPLLTFIFGVALMLAIGGSVQAGHHIGAGRVQAACATFSRTLVAVIAFATFISGLGFVFSQHVFAVLAVPAQLQPLLQPYFHILLLGMPPQLIAVVLYYFLRAAGHPGVASRALVAGALINILLDVLLLGLFKLDLRAAAWATVAAQLTQFILLLVYFRTRQRLLSWAPNWHSWRALWSSVVNGFSEFINEVSGGLVLLAIHWLLTEAHGVQGVAAFALINYSLLVNLMVACAVAEVVQVLVAQNIGAGQHQRAIIFRRCGIWTVLCTGGLLYLLVLTGSESVSLWLFGAAESGSAQYAQQFWPLVAPVFLLTGCNLVFSAWFTGLQQPLLSAVIAMSRSLLLPLAFIAAIIFGGSKIHFLWALPAAEGATLLLAITFLWRSATNAKRNRQSFTAATDAVARSL